jgi:NAD(P)-dependent dehydrogenase (short-subunit alcohol dehydrogenase family)
VKQLTGQWALVTGAAKRVGRSIALELARRGANLLVHHNTSATEARSVVDEVRALGREGETLQADLGDAGSVRALAAAALARAGRVDVLVNSASNYLRVAFDALDEDVWDRSLDVNLKAPYLLAVVLGRAMRQNGSGNIVNLVDWAAERPYRSYLPYCVSKAGLVCLTKALARELAPSVRVNAIAPGPVLLPEDMSAEETAAVVRATPLGRIGRPEDVAACVAFVVADAPFSTGAVFHVDGGRAIA